MPNRNRRGQFERSVARRRAAASAREHAKTTAKEPKQTFGAQTNAAPLSESSRMMDLHVVAKQMYCDECKCPLSFASIEGETVHGLASVLHIRCQCCLRLKDVATDRLVPDPNNPGSQVFEINLQSPSAICAEVGIEEEQLSQLSTLMSRMNLPRSDTDTTKKTGPHTVAAPEEPRQRSYSR